MPNHQGVDPDVQEERPGNRQMGFEPPRCSGSSRTLLPSLVATARFIGKIAANAGRTTSPCKRQVAGSSPAGSIMRARSSVGRAGRLSKPSSPQPTRWRMQMGIHRWRLRPAVRVRNFSSLLVAGTDQDGRMLVGLHGRAPASAGGRRFDPAPGNRVAQQRCLTNSRRPPVRRGECRRDYMDFSVAGSSPAGPHRSVAQWLEHEAVPQTLVAALTIFTLRN
jgi:hypothetical protein